MTRFLNSVTALVFFFILLSGSVYFLLATPPAEIPEERRAASPPPTFDYQSFESGEFLKASEAYLLDAMPYRRNFFSLHTKIFADVLKNPNCHGIREGAWGLEKSPPAYEDDLLLGNLDTIEHYLSRFFEGKRAYAALIPHKGYYTGDKTGYDRAFCAMAAREGLRAIEIADTLTPSDYFYGDIHIRPECYGTFAEKLGAAIGFVPTENLYPSQKFSSRGTLALQFPRERYDTFLTLYDPEGVIASCEVTSTDGSWQSIYREDLIAGDPYDLYLGGEAGNGILSVKNPMATTKRRLIVLRDSFARAFLPYLVGDYAEIVLVDLRTPYPILSKSELLFADDATDILLLVSTHTLFSTKF